MTTITMRFIGICCFLDTPGGGKRVVLPVDKRANERGDGKHVPYLEVEVIDQPLVQGLFDEEWTYVRDLVTYRRYHLSGDRVRISNLVISPGASLNQLATYSERVPALTLVTPALRRDVGVAVLHDPPDPDRAAAYFDITHGDLHAGPPNNFPTRFSAQTQWPTRRLAQWVELQVPIPDGHGPTIHIDGAEFGERTIQLAPRTTRITIGNQLPADIERNTGDPAALQSEDFREHFRLYYDLLTEVPNGYSLPERTAALPNGCVGSQYP